MTTLAAEVAQWFGAAMIFAMVFVLWRAQMSKTSKIDLSSLIIDANVGQVTFAKFGGLLCLLTSTWLVVYLAVDKALTDITFAAYVAAWGAVKVAGDITGKPDAGSSTVTTTTATHGPPAPTPASPVPVAIIAKEPVPVRESPARKKRRKR